MDILEAMKKEMLRRNLSRRTIRTYMFYVRKFLLFCDKEPRRFSKKDCKEFLERFMERGVAGNTMNVVLNSLRFMMEEVLRKSMRLNIRYSKTPQDLPVYLTKDEVKGLIDAITNKRHKLLVSLMYGAGLRVSEVVNLRREDIYVESDVGWVRHGKGDKDRPFILPICLNEEIKRMMCVGSIYLFEGRNGHLSTRTVDVVIKRAARKAGIGKNVYPHTLRHSFATHVLEAGYDVTAVQALLGHSEPRTTLEYVHAVKPKMIGIRSPLDTL